MRTRQVHKLHECYLDNHRFSPERNYRHACWHMQSGVFCHILYIWAYETPDTNSFFRATTTHQSRLFFFLLCRLREWYDSGRYMRNFFSKFSLPDALGRKGEDRAERFLRQLGYRIMARNVTNPSGRRLGEIDIVALDGEKIVFVEVKTRKSADVPLGLSIRQEKLRRLDRIGEWYMKRAGWVSRKYRFDMVGIIEYPGKEAEIQHIKDIFL